MPSKNRKHFAAIANGKVIASVSSDSKLYRSATQADGKRTRWSEEADFYSVEVIETEERLEVGHVFTAPLLEIDEPDNELPAVEMPTAAEAFGSDGKVHVYGESGELEASFDARDVHVSLPEYGPGATVTAPTLPQAETQLVPVGRNGIAIELPTTYHGLTKKTVDDFKASIPEATPAAPERVYKTGQRYTKPGSGIIAKVFLVDDQGRAFARGNRRGLTKILMDESWVLV